MVPLLLGQRQITETNIETEKVVAEEDARYSLKEIASSSTSISEGRVNAFGL